MMKCKSKSLRCLNNCCSYFILLFNKCFETILILVMHIINRKQNGKYDLAVRYSLNVAYVSILKHIPKPKQLGHDG